MRYLGFKARLALWHGTAIVLILAAATFVGDRALSRMVMAQVDSALLTLAETEAALDLDDPEGRIHVYAARPDTGGLSLRRFDKFVQIVDAEGRVVDRSPSLGDAALPAPPNLLTRLRGGEIVTDTLPDLGGEPMRMVSLPIEVKGSFRYAIQVATPLRSTFAFLRTGRLLFLTGSAAILLAVTLIGSVLAKGALRPIDRIVAKARRIGESNLRERLPHPGTPDEVGRLVATLNEMLDRIERSFESQRRFTADASHEMRSPLSRLRTELEVTLRRPRAGSEYEDVLRSALDEVERLSRLTEELLTLARLDAGEGGGTPATPVALMPLVEEEMNRLKPEADTRKIVLVLEGSQAVAVKGAPDSLRLVVANLLHNAVKFSPPDCRVIVRIHPDEDRAVLAISDSGPGIPAEDVPRVFERFYRASASRSPEIPGVGLGLAITRAIVETHGGSIEVESAAGAGATFTVRLPLAA
ncbi:MAG TPA: ATP-binding protein [Candidatus Methylomirabilis sp.]|nr:ATP-binding protein [Candidatus Methylomirabilis sp.]